MSLNMAVQMLKVIQLIALSAKMQRECQVLNDFKEIDWQNLENELLKLQTLRTQRCKALAESQK